MSEKGRKGPKIRFPNPDPNRSQTTSHNTTHHGDAEYREMGCHTMLVHVIQTMLWNTQGMRLIHHGMEQRSKSMSSQSCPKPLPNTIPHHVMP
jgi:hypothetical protein